MTLPEIPDFLRRTAPTSTIAETTMTTETNVSTNDFELPAFLQAAQENEIADNTGETQDDFFDDVDRAVTPEEADNAVAEYAAEVGVTDVTYAGPTTEELEEEGEPLDAAGYGHNSGDAPGELTGEEQLEATSEHLKQIVDRIENVEIRKEEASMDLKELYAEAKSLGFDTKALRKIMSLRKKSKAAIAEERAVMETYMRALEMIF